MERLTLARDEIAVWRLPSDHPSPLETVLARYTGDDADSLILEPTPQGKPVLPGSQLRFNLAHSGEVALVAVARDRDVGVDVERVREDADRWALVDHALTAGERRQLQRVAPAGRAHAFLSMWTRKEALLKAAGVGLAIEPALVELEGDAVVAVPPELGTADDWTVMTVPLPSYVAAVAARSTTNRAENLQDAGPRAWRPRSGLTTVKSMGFDYRRPSRRLPKKSNPATPKSHRF